VGALPYISRPTSIGRPGHGGDFCPACHQAVLDRCFPEGRGKPVAGFGGIRWWFRFSPELSTGLALRTGREPPPRCLSCRWDPYADLPYSVVLPGTHRTGDIL